MTVSVGDIEQQWCPQCVQDEMGLDYAAYENEQESPMRYISAQTVTAFLAGAAIMLLISSILIV
ncbi:hypothetical protein C499_14060 [Halogeometricum borinquense DSM 11551]|uniref:Uncharacterized protein n=1 Tax=Halogeometricum borinquense (strain ATCC 700274 / DSM 11551 / JCM 10706 / KCTC 4070 / PR3) TaxID=469382 RepID=L9UN70_HALBP|nr:hypothetical protein C499_14060 [Halogeometricum borinquense DSM 11551]